MQMPSAFGFAIDASVMEADTNREACRTMRRSTGPTPSLDTRPVRQYLAALDPDPDPDRKAPKAISLSDPCSAWMAKANKRVQFGYGLNYLIDNKHAIIVNVEATPERNSDEVAATETMIERTDSRVEADFFNNPMRQRWRAERFVSLPLARVFIRERPRTGWKFVPHGFCLLRLLPPLLGAGLSRPHP